MSFEGPFIWCTAAKCAVPLSSYQMPITQAARTWPTAIYMDKQNANDLSGSIITPSESAGDRNYVNKAQLSAYLTSLNGKDTTATFGDCSGGLERNSACLVRCAPNYRLKRAPLSDTEANGETDAVAASPWRDSSATSALDDAVIYFCDYDLASADGVVRYLPLLDGSAVIDSAHSATVCTNYAGTSNQFPDSCKNIRANQCERRQCNDTEPLIQASWFGRVNPSVGGEGEPYGIPGALIAGRARATEYLRIYKPYNYDNCYVTSAEGKRRLQHADQCTVSCRADNGFIGTANIQYKCVG